MRWGWKYLRWEYWKEIRDWNRNTNNDKIIETFGDRNHFEKTMLSVIETNNRDWQPCDKYIYTKTVILERTPR